MIRGDLVRLSAYGRKIQGYMELCDGYGLITKSFSYAGNQRLKLVWFYPPTTRHPKGTSRKLNSSFARKDLKLFKAKEA